MRLSLVRGHLEHRRETEQLYSIALMARYFHVCRMDTPTVKAYVHCWYLSWLRLDVLLQYPPPVAPAVAQSAALSRQFSFLSSSHRLNNRLNARLCASCTSFVINGVHAALGALGVHIAAASPGSLH